MKIGLMPRLIAGIMAGIIIGMFMPVPVCRIVVTLSGIFSSFLKFVVPLMILAYVTMGIAKLSQGAGKLLLLTVALSYASTLIAGSASYLVSSELFPSFINSSVLAAIADTPDVSLKPYFSLDIPPVIPTISAVVLAFVLGLSLSVMKGK